MILHLMGRAGAKRIRLLESAWTPDGIEADSLEEHMLQCLPDQESVALRLLEVRQDRPVAVPFR